LALQEARVGLQDLEAVAVTRGPGLVGSLLVGISVAKSLSYVLGVPLAGVNHLEAHVRSPFLENPDLPLPALCLLASGGHTGLYLVDEQAQCSALARTRDDAAGEAFDKVAKLMGLGYPGGPVIDRLAVEGNEKAVRFPLARMTDGTLDFSFSGLKTAVSQAIAPHGPPPHPDELLADVAASFQAAVVETLVAKTTRALDSCGARALTLGGGVACNRELRARLAAACDARAIPLRVPSPRLCADNAAMIALLGSATLRRGEGGEEELDAVASLEESGLPMGTRSS